MFYYNSDSNSENSDYNDNNDIEYDNLSLSDRITAKFISFGKDYIMSEFYRFVESVNYGVDMAIETERVLQTNLVINGKFISGHKPNFNKNANYIITNETKFYDALRFELIDDTLYFEDMDYNKFGISDLSWTKLYICELKKIYDRNIFSIYSFKENDDDDDDSNDTNYSLELNTSIQMDSFNDDFINQLMKTF